MSKIPYIERAYGGSGLTGECAYLWALFLANEADMADDPIKYDKFKAMAETLAPKEGVATAASVHYPDLEAEISKYQKQHWTDPSAIDQIGGFYNAKADEYVYPGSDPQE